MERRTRVRSIGVRYGADRRENDWYRERYPEVLEAAQEKGLAKVFSLQGKDGKSAGFDESMARYVADPFRGATVRYVLGENETVLSLELDAARDALSAAEIGVEDFDLILSASWLPEDFVAPGNGVYLARDLCTPVPAFNVETACSSGLACLEVAEGLLSAGRYGRVLVVLSSTVSRQASKENTLGWISSDVAAAAVLELANGNPDEGILGSYMENTAATCGVFNQRLVEDGVVMEVGPAGGKPLREASGPDLVHRICTTALGRSGHGIDEIDFFGCSSPLAWFTEMCAEAMAVPVDKTNDLFPRLGNAGLPFPLVHLHHAMAEGKLAPGDLALLYTMGSVSAVGAAVVEVGDVALGPHPAGR